MFGAPCSMQTLMQTHKHNMQMHMGSNLDLKGFFKVSLPAFQVPANNQSMASGPLDPEIEFGPQKEWEEKEPRPWLGPNAIPVLPYNATEEQVIEALEMWGMPTEAWPVTGKNKGRAQLVNYTLHKKDHPDITVCLGRQMFTTKPPHEKHTYYSFWMSQEFEVGPVANPYGIPCKNITHKGYNHCMAALAFGEIQLLAGWADEPFLLQWHSQFNEHKLPMQQFPPVLHGWILLQPVQPDFLHIVDQGMAATKVSTSAPGQLKEKEKDEDEDDKIFAAQPAQLPDVDHQTPAQPAQLTDDVDWFMHQDASFQMLDVDQIYLMSGNGGATVIKNVHEIGPDAKKKMVDGKEVIKLCDDGINRVVWEVPMAGVDGWQCL